MSCNVPTFPIPVFVGCILAYTAIRLWQGHHRNILVAVLIGICAVQSMIIALAQHYEVSSMRILQPIIASLIPASTWIAYQNTNIRAPSYQDLQHLLGTVLVIGALLSTPQFLDLLIPCPIRILRHPDPLLRQEWRRYTTKRAFVQWGFTRTTLDRDRYHTHRIDV